MAIFKFDTLLPKPNIKPINDKIKFVFVKTILKASLQVHLAYLVGWYTAPLFFVALFNNVSGLHSFTNNENINDKPHNTQQIYIEWIYVISSAFSPVFGYHLAAGAIKALITVPNKPPVKNATLFIVEAYDLNLGLIVALSIEKPNG